MGYWGSGIIGKIISKVPVRVIYPFIFVTSIVAVYALRNTLFDVGMMFVFGFVGYFFKKFDYSLPAFIIAFILGPGAERALRQALLLSENGVMIFLERPLAIFFITLAILVVGVRMYQTIRKDIAPSKAG
jgi:putative tricarboxylic transport membrane protein